MKVMKVVAMVLGMMSMMGAVMATGVSDAPGLFFLAIYSAK